MAENDATPGAQGNPPAGAQSGNDSGMIPKARFDEVNERMKAAERKLAESAAAEEQRNRAELEAKGQYDKLKADYEARIAALEPAANEWQTYQATRRETLLAGLSDDDKPLADGLPLDKLEALVSRLGKDRAAAPAPAPAARPGHTAQGGMATPEEIQLNIAKPGWLLANKHRIPGASIG